MQTFTVEITNDNALEVLQELQEKHFINILAKPNLKSNVFPGEPLTPKEFKDIVTNAENSGSVSLKEAKGSWAKQRKELQKFAK